MDPEEGDGKDRQCRRKKGCAGRRQQAQCISCQGRSTSGQHPLHVEGGSASRLSRPASPRLQNGSGLAEGKPKGGGQRQSCGEERSPDGPMVLRGAM
jgi:hypothetical protein